MTALEPLKPCKELASIRLLCSDVDGVMTDGSLFYGSGGQRMWRFHVLDGMGLKKLQGDGVPVCMISQSKSEILKKRAEDLGLAYCYVGVDDKQIAVDALIQELGIDASAVAHIADDENDLTLLKTVGVPICVPNAVPAVKETCRSVTQTEGGAGAVRELCETILESRRQWQAL